jgi:hypothetical protein
MNMTEAELQALHDRATRGERLSAKEQAALDIWYAQQDQLESQLLQASVRSSTLIDLHAQVTAASTQLTTVTQHIRDVLAENDKLRQEITQLQLQLAQQPAGHTV